MATKNLARTATEGGRRNDWKLRREETVKERQKVRAYERLAAAGMDADAKPMPRRVPDKGLLTDKLKPLEKYLQANAGRPWDKVYSELCKKFDRRSLQGNHILTDHIDRHMVDGHKHGDFYSRYRIRSYGAFVDKHGILRYRQRNRNGHRR